MISCILLWPYFYHTFPFICIICVIFTQFLKASIHLRSLSRILVTPLQQEHNLSKVKFQSRISGKWGGRKGKKWNFSKILEKNSSQRVKHGLIVFLHWSSHSENGATVLTLWVDWQSNFAVVVKYAFHRWYCNSTIFPLNGSL